ncbi:hypothetical protein K0I63_16080 [Shewanella rhizosphaerae]|uniref:hypothetical protein n=1 Tax=Shewanella rhizosphaerae TaxID=2864207 RepID=UPI001C65CC7C|nr:hypothetical protein [Shewanella rhizosphaerae]QYK12244.1 hypothetical protein K0I63_16080 [Shewanella rhizosphaerae]
MSSTKAYWFDRIEAQNNSRLAKLLGITEDELEQISYDIDGDYSNDGLLYGYVVQFDNDNDPSIMAKIDGLTSGSYVSLSQWELEDPEEDELEWELDNSEQLEMFNKQLAEIPALLQIETTQSAQFSLLVMLHAHVVSTLEHFLLTTFIHCVTSSDKLTRKLIETDPEFGNRKFTVNEIYAQHSNIKSTVATYLKGIIFHDMRKVKPMYAEVLACDFGDISWLFRAVRLRHDCVHRAGYEKDGKSVTVSVESIKELVKNCRELAEKIDTHVQELDSE